MTCQVCHYALEACPLCSALRCKCSAKPLTAYVHYDADGVPYQTVRTPKQAEMVLVRGYLRAEEEDGQTVAGWGDR